MKVIVYEPLTMPYVKEIDPSLESLQREVGGIIQAIYPFEDEVALICNDNGKIDGLMRNRWLMNEDGEIYDCLCGNFLIVGLGEEDFADVPEELIDKYMNAMAISHMAI